MCAQDFDLDDEYVPVYSNPKKRISEKTSDRRKCNKLWSLLEVVKLVDATALGRANAKDASLPIPKVFGFNDNMKLDQRLKDYSDQVDGVGKSVTYLRLDGSVETEKRFEIVKAFNSDPTIDALLLTTHVGGLGLNLTSTDTLIFTKHDWNPR
ncbi:btaf1 RNA polymerase II, B-TFIID transcription factor-associated, 170kDa [Dionaea muscipula]